MPASVHYKGELYFASYSELEEGLHLIENEVSEEDAGLKVDRPQLKLTIAVSAPFSKNDQLEATFHKAVVFAKAGMILASHDEIFEDVICSDRFNGFNPERPAILMFTLHEFERSFGKLEMNISDVVYDSPFYIYDQSLREVGPKFADEVPINGEDNTVGFDILKMIWTDYIARSSTFLFSSLFKKSKHPERNTFTIAPTYGFAPGYSMDAAIAEAKTTNFIVFKWNEYWDQ